MLFGMRKVNLQRKKRVVYNIIRAQLPQQEIVVCVTFEIKTYNETAMILYLRTKMTHNKMLL